MFVYIDMARIRFNLDLGRIEKNVKQFPDKLDGYLNAVVGYTATEGTAYMKENAPWTDRTTAARNGLHTVPENTESRKKIIFSHTVPYGIWLEIANSGKYQIIMPTVRREGNLLMKRFEGLIDKMARDR